MIEQLLQQAVEQNASDIFLIAGLPFSIKVNGSIRHLNDEKLYPLN